MKKWGLGIEHEMRVRFKNNISSLPKDVINVLFPDVKNEYIFISSNTLLYYFKTYELSIMNDFEKYANTEEEKIYLKNLLIKKNLLELAKKKERFPLEDKSIFNIYSNENITKNSLDNLNFYLKVYTLFNTPLLFFSYNFNNEINMDLNILLKYNEIINSIYNDENKTNTMNLLDESLNELYNDNYEKEAFNYLKKLFKTKYVKDFIFYNTESEYFNIDIIYAEESNSFDIDKFFKKIDKYIETFRNIFNETKFIIEGVDNYKIYKNLFTLYHNNIPHIDGTYQSQAIEFKTINYDSISYEKTLNDLVDLEKTFFYIMNKLPIIKDIVDTFGILVYHNIGSIKDSVLIYDIINITHENIKEDYTGSYHVWITAPYSVNMTMKRFINMHSTLANKLQLLEPILAAHYTSPSYNSLYNNTYSKSSLRQFINNFSNYGTTDVSLMNGSKKHIVNGYYMSENNILKNTESYIPTVGGPYQSNIYDMKGNLIINYDKLNTRYITNNLFKLIHKGNEESEKIDVVNYYEQIFEKTKIRPISTINNMKYLMLGADIRTRDLNEYFYPLDKEWSKIYLMKNNKLREIYYNQKLNKISYERIFDKNIYKKKLSNRIGIEFRIFDHFPTNYLNQFLALLVPIVLDTEKNPKVIKFKNSYVAKQFWHDEMFNVMTKGYEYTLSLKYIHHLEKEFNVKFAEKKFITSEIILNMLYTSLIDKYSKSYKNSLFNKLKFKSKIKFINFNKKAWYEIINQYFEENPQKLRQILYYNKELKNNNIIEILGKKYNFNLSKIKNYLSTFE